MYSDEVTFHISACVNLHNVCIWGSANSHTTVEHHLNNGNLSGVLCHETMTVLVHVYLSKKLLAIL